MYYVVLAVWVDYLWDKHLNFVFLGIAMLEISSRRFLLSFCVTTLKVHLDFLFLSSVFPSQSSCFPSPSVFPLWFPWISLLLFYGRLCSLPILSSSSELESGYLGRCLPQTSFLIFYSFSY